MNLVCRAMGRSLNGRVSAEYNREADVMWVIQGRSGPRLKVIFSSCCDAFRTGRTAFPRVGVGRHKKY